MFKQYSTVDKDFGFWVNYDEITPFSSVYNTPPEKVRSSIPELGIGTFCEIDKSSGHYVYQFQNGRLNEF